jgi:hypothetical protein
MARKRWRTPKAKKGELKACYGSEYGDLDIYYCYNGINMSCDSRLLSSFFEYQKSHEGFTLREELKRRGYDITTLKFSIQKLKQSETGNE